MKRHVFYGAGEVTVSPTGPTHIESVETCNTNDRRRATNSTECTAYPISHEAYPIKTDTEQTDPKMTGPQNDQGNFQSLTKGGECCIVASPGETRRVQKPRRERSSAETYMYDGAEACQYRSLFWPPRDRRLDMHDTYVGERRQTRSVHETRTQRAHRIKRDREHERS